MKYILAYDIGTTGLKTCLFEVDKTIKLLTSANHSYPLYVLENGGAEQDGDDWYFAMQETTKELFSKTDIKPNQIAGISFCSQMQGLVLVDDKGNAIRRPMSYMDQRAKEEIKKGMAYGLQIAGANIFKLIPSIIITGAVSCSVKDPVWKYKWVEANEPENFAKVYKWLDVKDYLTCRLTGEFAMSQDSAFATMLYDARKGKNCFSKTICDLLGVNMKHLPKIIKCHDVVGPLTKKAASELGLVEGIPVFSGGGDSSLIGVGAGSVRLHDTHIYSGTSGWVITQTDKQLVDTDAMIAAIVGPQEGRFNYFAEMETCGKCLEWAKDHLAHDEIDMYLSKQTVADQYESEYTNLFNFLLDQIKTVPVGSNGVIFTPWLHGNRCPFEDPNAEGMFIGVKISTGKRELLRAILEGSFYHLRWMLECQEKKVETSPTIRFVGGGALNPISCQILADILGKTVETVPSPQNVGAVGACAIAAVGLGIIPTLDDIYDYIPVDKTFVPNEENHKQYEKYYQVFKKLYKANKNIFKELNKEN